MTRTLLPLSLAACLLAAPAVGAAPDRGDRLLAPERGDVAAHTLTADVAPVAAELDHTPVSWSWPIDQADHDLEARPTPHRAESRACWHLASAAALAAGVPLAVSVPGAVLWLSPQDGSSLDLAAVELVDPRGAVHVGADGLRPLARPEQPEDAGAPFPPGTAVFEVRPELGAGAFVLRARVRGPHLVRLHERDAPTYLSLEPSSDLALAGRSVHLVAHLREGPADLEVRSITGELVAPDGARSSFPLTRAADGSHHADVTAASGPLPPGVLHTLLVHAEGVTARGLPVRRTATCAFAVSPPTARYTGAVAIEDVGPGGVHIRLGVEVATASRFAASALLYGTSRHGRSQPIAVAQAARWLEPGAAELVLDFDAATIAASGLHAPYELRDLRLVDQGRLAPLHRQARAFALPPARQ